MIKLERRASAVLYNFLKSNFSSSPYIIPANVCPAVPLTFLKAGIGFEIFDIDNKSHCLSEEAILDAFKKNQGRYAGLLYVRTYGVEDQRDDFFKAIKRIDPKLVIIDDRCLCKPRFDIDESCADLTLFSTGYGKYVDIGSGGIGFIAEGMKYSNYIINGKVSTGHFAVSYQKQIDKFESCLQSSAKFVYVDNDWLESGSMPPLENYRKTVATKTVLEDNYRSTINNIYVNNLPSEIQFPSSYQNWRFNLLIEKKKIMLERIFKDNLFASSHYKPISTSFNQEKAPNAEYLFKRVINLFNNKKVTPEMALKTCQIISSSL